MQWHPVASVAAITVERCVSRSHLQSFRRGLLIWAVPAGNKNASLDGGLAVAVPLELKGMWMAHQRYGQAPWATLASPAASLARNGFPAHPYLVNALNESSVMTK